MVDCQPSKLVEVGSIPTYRFMVKKRNVLCVKNDGYPASLQLGKIYVSILDKEAEKQRLIRVIDESEDEYLFPISYFKVRSRVYNREIKQRSNIRFLE